MVCVVPRVAAPAAQSHWTGTTRTASTNSQADVQTTVNASADGDIVVIPDGSVTWSSGINTSKQILFRAATLNPTSQGRSTQSLVITNNAGTGRLFEMATGSSFPCGIAGIRFNEGTGTGNHVRFTGSGSKVPIIYDCCMEVKQRNGTSQDVCVLAMLATGGLIWRHKFIPDPDGSYTDTVGPDGACMVIESPRAWNTASTMGTLDTDGNVNVYYEDSTAKDVGQCPDIDDNGRVVVRYSLLDGVSGLTHGFTSTWGGRHFEYYNNTFAVHSGERNHNGRYFWIRAGTGVFTDNVVNHADNSSAYNGGNVEQTDIGDTTSPGTYPQPRQPGYGHNGTTDVSDPIYIWSQTGTHAYDYGFSNGWGAIVVVDRDIFVNNGSKSGYSKYTYPHPLTSGCPLT